jgi:hypothetical protein
LESWINIEKGDFEPPGLTGLKTEGERKDATSKSFMTNTRSYLVSICGLRFILNRAKRKISADGGEINK